MFCVVMLRDQCSICIPFLDVMLNGIVKFYLKTIRFDYGTRIGAIDDIELSSIVLAQCSKAFRIVCVIAQSALDGNLNNVNGLFVKRFRCGLQAKLTDSTVNGRKKAIKIKVTNSVADDLLNNIVEGIKFCRLYTLQ